MKTKIPLLIFASFVFLFSFMLCGCDKESSYTIRFDGGDSILLSGAKTQVVANSNDIEEPVFDRYGYIFGGWDKDLSSLRKDTNVKAKWQPLINADNFKVNNNGVIYIEVKNSVSTFKFKDNINVKGNFEYSIFTDFITKESIDINEVKLEEGDNIFYIETKGYLGERIYTVNVYRKKLLTLDFYVENDLFDSKVVEEGKTLSEINISEPVIGGYDFFDWDIDKTMPIHESCNINALLINKETKIVFHPNNGKSDIEKIAYYGLNYNFPFVDKEGYSLVGWFSANGDKVEQGYWENNTGDLNLYAVWQPNSYNVSFYDDGPYVVSFDLNGVDGEIAPIVVTKENNIFVYPNVPEREGYVFAGWCTSADCSEMFEYNSTINSNITLYAKWIEFSGDDKIDFLESKDIYVIPKNNGSKKYYGFVPSVSGTIKIYSSGSLDTYGFLYDGNKALLATDDDSGTDRNFSITYTVKAGELYYISPTGYSSSGTTTIYISGQKVIGAELKFVEIGTKTVTYDEDYILEAPTKEGFVFVGWYDKENNKYEKGKWTISSDIALYACWEKAE